MNGEDLNFSIVRSEDAHSLELDLFCHEEDKCIKFAKNKAQSRMPKAFRNVINKESFGLIMHRYGVRPVRIAHSTIFLLIRECEHY